jgi:hypothetical protein
MLVDSIADDGQGDLAFANDAPASTLFGPIRPAMLHSTAGEGIIAAIWSKTNEARGRRAYA